MEIKNIFNGNGWLKILFTIEGYSRAYKRIIPVFNQIKTHFDQLSCLVLLLSLLIALFVLFS